MTTKRLLGIVLTISCLALLAATVSTAAPTATRGGTFVFEIATDLDYIDPQLSYYGETWKLEAATACKLMNWQDKEGAAGAVATPEVAGGSRSSPGTAGHTRSRSSRAFASPTASR